MNDYHEKISNCISEKDITIIVQGAITEYTCACLNSLRTILNGAHIILSTWINSCLDGLDYDDIVLSKDPGSEYIDESTKLNNNVNRQIVSTQNGLKLVNTKYCFKFRSDLILKDKNFLQYYEWFSSDYLQNCMFEKRILICNFYTRNPRVYPMPFHPSDWIAFGLTKDLKSYYCDIPLQKKDEMLWFKHHKKSTEFQINCLSKYVPEQFIFLSFLQKLQPEIMCLSYYDVSKENIIITEKLFAANFIVLDYQNQVNINFLKYKPNRYGDLSTLINHKDWLILYNYYCRGKKSFQWCSFLLKCFFIRILHKVKAQLIKILAFFHLKEIIKTFLNKKKKR